MKGVISAHKSLVLQFIPPTISSYIVLKNPPSLTPQSFQICPLHKWILSLPVETYMYVCMCVCIYNNNNNIEHTQSISSSAQYVTPAKYFSHPYLLSFATPPIKLKLGWQIITNSKPPEPIIMMDQSETLISCEIVFIALFSARTEPKTISLSQTGVFLTFLHPIVLCRVDLIQSTAGDALIQFWASTLALSLSHVFICLLCCCCIVCSISLIDPGPLPF